MRATTTKRLRELGLGTAALAILASSYTGDLRAQGKPPLLIRDQGNFYVNAEKVQTPYNDTCKQAAGCAGIAPFEGGTDEINQAYMAAVTMEATMSRRRIDVKAGAPTL